jgi:hypothetical protein
MPATSTASAAAELIPAMSAERLTRIMPLEAG